MIRLAAKLLLFISILLIFSNICSYFVLKSPLLIHVLETRKSTDWIYSAIDKSKAPVASDVIILGDSVALQMFKPGNSNFILSAPATIVGQYIVLSSILHNKNNVKKVILVCYPGSLLIKINNIYSYNHFVKPFYCQENKPLISNSVEADLKLHRYYYLYNLPISKVLPAFTLIDCSQSNHVVANESYEYGLFIEYMKKIIELCTRNNVELKILSPPVSATHNNLFDFIKLKKVINDNNFNAIFSYYFETLIVTDDLYFRNDHWHYKEEYKDKMSIEFRDIVKRHINLPDI